MTYRLILSPDRFYSGRRQNPEPLASLFDADLHAFCRERRRECDRSDFLIERIDEEPGMPRRVRRP